MSPEWAEKPGDLKKHFFKTPLRAYNYSTGALECTNTDHVVGALGAHIPVAFLLWQWADKTPWLLLTSPLLLTETLSPGSLHCAQPWKYRTVFQIPAILCVTCRWTMLSLCSSASRVTRDHHSSLWSSHPCIYIFFFFLETLPFFFGRKATLPYSFWCQLEQLFTPKHLTTVLYCQNMLLRSWNRSVSTWISAEGSQVAEAGLFAHHCTSPWQSHSALLLLREVKEVPRGQFIMFLDDGTPPKMPFSLHGLWREPW